MDAPATGRLGLSTPWARQYLPPADRPAVVERIPAGHTLGISAVRKPGQWAIWLISDDTHRPVWQVQLFDHDLQRACLRALAWGPLSLVWCSGCDQPSVIEIDGEAWCASHEPAKEVAA